ncbi:putative manganese transporter [uncultured Pseudokineococcus sp.]|uniref:putative manganese transporter n=1 Tax=uncultured Pseudokineococcus sp. TaxID=1642928 RepID=UPI002601BAA4|nr:putative manganese transporter [uncultured Pseudokineococcus sp.]
MPLLDRLATALADAFLQVGVPVAVLVAAFGWLQVRHGDRLLDLLARRARWAPAVGAVLGVSPGCAGAILVVPLFLRGTVSFGTVVAALVATMGDSSWVIIAGEPVTALVVHAVLLVTGVVTGYVVDAVGLGPSPEDLAAERAVPAVRRAAATTSGGPWRRLALRAGPVGVTASPPPSGPPPLRASAPAERLEPLDRVFWAVVVLSVPAAVAVAAQARTGPLAALGGVDPLLVLGVLGSLVCGAVLLARRGGRERLSADVRTPAEVLRRGAAETSVIVGWVAAVFVGWEVLSGATGFDGSQLPLVGVAGVVVGALVGLVPGCAVQIVLTSLYLTGAVPFATLLANAVSQDGDALIPLLALRRRSAVLASAVTVVPALVVGGVALLVTG